MFDETRATVLTSMWTEADRADLLHGPMYDVADGTGPEHRESANEARLVCQDAFAVGEGTWRDVLLEEVFEAIAEDEPERLKAELRQVGAVVLRWLEAIDARPAAAS